ncbi:hypothetical protein DSL92_03115 [Billgrantia gudaonensis]|uniref:Deacetylase sirtuin-type domain-containing protein n=1 Tax=Billgrantia gudaonensis TaxID=376427 RepID=A0A432JJS5_9GAMM|nr:hypothetical protein DSL92_03115 [Halomonas gudaonensis]
MTCATGQPAAPRRGVVGESVPRFGEACEIAAASDLLLVVGTSLAVMPAASLLDQVGMDVPCVLVDPRRMRWRRRGYAP